MSKSVEEAVSCYSPFDRHSHFQIEDVKEEIYEKLAPLKKLKDNDSKGRMFLERTIDELKEIPGPYQDEPYHLCDGAHDCGIDAFRIIEIDLDSSEEEEVKYDIELYQVKYNKAFNYNSSTEDLEKYHRLLKNPGKERVNEKLKPVVEKLKDRDSINEIRYQYITDSELLQQTIPDLELYVQKKFRHVERLYEQKLNHNFLSFEDLVRFKYPEEFDIILDITPGDHSSGYAKLITDRNEAYMFFVRVEQLAEVWNGIPGKLRRLNGKNCRSYMGDKKPVNKSIMHSLVEDSVLFHVYNLGLWISCKGLEFETLDGREVVRLISPEIHNGGQTATNIDKAINDLKNKSQAYIALHLVFKKDMSKEEEEKMNIYTNHSTPPRSSAWASQRPEVKEFKKNMEKYDINVILRDGNVKKINRKGCWYNDRWINIHRLSIHKNMYVTMTQKLKTTKDEDNFLPYGEAFTYLQEVFEGFNSESMCDLGLLVARQHDERHKRNIRGSEALWHSMCGHLIRSYLLAVEPADVRDGILFVHKAKELILSTKDKNRQNVSRIYDLAERGFRSYCGDGSDGSGIWKKEKVKKSTNNSLTGILNQNAEDYCNPHYAGKLQILHDQMSSCGLLIKRKEGDLEAVMEEIENNEVYHMFVETTEEVR